MTDFANRHQVEEHLAQQAEGGVIVELGGGYGHGAIALAHGAPAGMPIYVVDPYEPYHDENGSDYGPETLEQFRANVQEAEVRERIMHLQMDAITAAHTWGHPVALLWIDLSMKFDRLWPIVLTWLPHMAGNSTIAITGLEYNHLGTRQALDELARRGWRRELAEQRLVAVLRKTEDVRERAVFYICSDGDRGRYVREAARSAASAKRNLGLPCYLFLQGELRPVDNFDAVHPLPSPRGPFWYLDSARYFVQAVEALHDYSQLLYLDVDTYVCMPCLDIFTPLEKFDMLFGLSAQRDAIESAIETPASFTTRQIGVNPFNNTPRVRAFLAYWLALYEEHHRIYDNNDEAPMRDALYSWPDVRIGLLPPEYCLRFDFGAWMVGRVRILHGRIGGISTDRRLLEAVAEEINSSTAMRIWNHGLIPGN